MSIVPLLATGLAAAGSAPGAATATVVVAARLQLIAQALGAALRGRGVNAVARGWGDLARRTRRDLGAGDVVVLLDDLVSTQDLEATCDLVAGTPARCVVLTRRTAGPAWGALLAAGAAAVCTSVGSVDEVDDLVGRVARGEPATVQARREELIGQWQEWQAEDERLRAGLARLSPRERQVLVLLSQGTGVSDIVDVLGVAETTVRSQIKSMRRKLGVGSQLGAVAALHRVGGQAASVPDAMRVAAGGGW